MRAAGYTATWIKPLTQMPTATEFLTLMNGLPLAANADTAFGHLSDSATALESRRARHPCPEGGSRNSHWNQLSAEGGLIALLLVFQRGRFSLP